MKRLLALLLTSAALHAGAADFALLDRQSARQLLAPPPDARPTVIALWASDCSYCKQNLRTLAGLARRHPQLRIITVAAEPPGPATRLELDNTGIHSERLAYGNDLPEAIAFAIDPDWHGELPRTYLFNGKGAMQTRSGLIDAAGYRTALGLR